MQINYIVIRCRFFCFQPRFSPGPQRRFHLHDWWWIERPPKEVAFHHPGIGCGIALQELRRNSVHRKEGGHLVLSGQVHGQQARIHLLQRMHRRYGRPVSEFESVQLFDRPDGIQHHDVRLPGRRKEVEHLLLRLLIQPRRS